MFQSVPLDGFDLQVFECCSVATPQSYLKGSSTSQVRLLEACTQKSIRKETHTAIWQAIANGRTLYKSEGVSRLPNDHCDFAHTPPTEPSPIPMGWHDAQ